MSPVKTVVSCGACASKELEYYPYRNQRCLRWQHVLGDWVKHCLGVGDLFSPQFNIALCASCGYGKYDRAIDPALLSRYYTGVYYRSGGFVQKDHQDFLMDERAIGQFSFVRGFLNDLLGVDDILEMGAAEAFAAQLLRRHYPHIHIDVVEPGWGWQSYYQGVGINCVANFFPFASLKKYSYIHASHWLEHLVMDVPQALSALKALLKPGGLVFVEVPNCTLEYWRKDSTIDPPGHIHYFSQQALEHFFQRAGFEILKVGAFGMTHIERNRSYVTPGALDANIIKESSRSIMESIPRQSGEYLRMLVKAP